MLELIAMLEKSSPASVKGTAVFLTGNPGQRPRRRSCTISSTTRCCTSRTSSCTSATEDAPRVEDGEPGLGRAAVGQFLAGDAALRLHGDAERAQGAAGVPRRQGFKFDIMRTSFFLSRRSHPARRRSPACRSGRTSCSSASPAAPATPASTSASRPAARWRSGRRLRSDLAVLSSRAAGGRRLPLRAIVGQAKGCCQPSVPTCSSGGGAGCNIRPDRQRDGSLIEMHRFWTGDLVSDDGQGPEKSGDKT